MKVDWTLGDDGRLIGRIVGENAMTTETRLILQQALDAMWGEFGNGYGTPYESLIAKLQETLNTSNYR